MTSGRAVETAELRARFALRLAELYGTEVPAYNTLVDVSRQVNTDVLASQGADAERLGSIDRVTAERHGAIRVGSPTELGQVARVFGAFGMFPVGFYDLRDTAGAGIPVVATAFRPTDAAELARNPFRVFTSMLATNDKRFFDQDTQRRLVRFLGERQLFTPDLLQLADRAAAEGGLPEPDAAVLLDLATNSFTLSGDPIDRDWYDHLSEISSVAADIGGVSSTHINHLTPRVLDIDELYRRMQARGIEMIDAIQGPPHWDGPDVLLRQTSFRALAERRRFRQTDGSVVLGELRVRFGEVEQRGIALTSRGLELYDRAMAAIAREEVGNAEARDGIARHVWARTFPAAENDLATDGTAWFTYTAHTGTPPVATARLSELIAARRVTAEPIVYEDFLPLSAAGIFRSNLSGRGSRDDSRVGTDYDIDRLSEIVGTQVIDPQNLYRAQRRKSLDAVARKLCCTIVDDVDGTGAASVQ